jgi:hypothetical protein
VVFSRHYESSTKKTDPPHDITEILLKLVLNTITLNPSSLSAYAHDLLFLSRKEIINVANKNK